MRSTSGNVLPFILIALSLQLLGQGSFADEQTDYKERVSATLDDVDKLVAKGPFDATWESLQEYEIPTWYKDAKFGIFIHWGVYSVPAYGNEWYPRRMYIDSKGNKERSLFNHHKETWGPQSRFGYKDFIPMFRAEDFDAEAWAKLFKEAGARYVVPVAEHHDGFPMYDCSFTNWDSTQMGPKRDVVAELAEAIRAQDMRLGVSSHRAFNWAYFARRDDFDTVDPANEGLYGKSLPWLFTEEAKNHRNPWPPHDKQFKDDWLARTAELVEKYDPALVWFDFGIASHQVKSFDENPFASHLQRFAACYYNHASQRGNSAIINYKWNAYPEKAAVLDLERSKMEKIRYPFWQTDTAVSSSSWGYTENQKYKTTDRLVDDLIDIVAKNGCLLLNVGPKANGKIPEEDQRILREIGDWLEINGEAVYGSRPWSIYGEGPTETATGHLSEWKNKPFTAQDIRFTKKDGAVFAICLGWPGDEIVIKSFSSNSSHTPQGVKDVRMLGTSQSLKWRIDEAGMTIALPGESPCDHAVVFKIECSGTNGLQSQLQPSRDRRSSSLVRAK